MTKQLAKGIVVLMATSAGYAFGAYEYSEDFTNTMPTGEGNWAAQYVNAGGNYNDGNAEIANWDAYDASKAAPPALPADPNGNYANFYARYDDATILQTFWFKNLGGYGSTDPYSANNGEHTFTACYYVNTVANGGADLSNGVTAGLGVRIAGAGYSQWPGDDKFSAKKEIAADVTRGTWQRLSLTFDINDGGRVDIGFYNTNPALTDPYISTGVLWDDMWIGASSNAPTDACGAAQTGDGDGDGDGDNGGADDNGGGATPGPSVPVPVMPLGGLLGLIGLVGWLGLRRRG